MLTVKVSFPIHITGTLGIALKLGNVGAECVKHPDTAISFDRLQAKEMEHREVAVGWEIINLI